MHGIKKIKNYRLIRETGRGANGIVYEAIDDATKKKFAIKSIPAEKISEKQILNSFKNELKALHKISHKNIIKIFGVEKTVNNIYLVLDFANGGNLFQYLNYYHSKYKSQLPEYVIHFLLKQIVKGLEYMHSNNIMHRDLKLDNILLKFNHTTEKINYDSVNIMDAIVLIADLGYAKLLSEDFDCTKSVCGTPIIMAPDMINLHEFDNVGKDLTYNSKVDLWSLGTITYQLIFGIPPFLAKNVNELFKEILRGKYKLPKNVKISIETVTFLNGLLQFYPEKRLDWNGINSHPFILNNIKDFHEFEINQIETNDIKQIEVDSKNCDNFLWVMFKPRKQNMQLDKLNIKESIYEDSILKIHETLGEKLISTETRIKSPRIDKLEDKIDLDYYKKDENDIEININGDDDIEDEKTFDSPESTTQNERESRCIIINKNGNGGEQIIHLESNAKINDINILESNKKEKFDQIKVVSPIFEIISNDKYLDNNIAENKDIIDNNHKPLDFQPHIITICDNNMDQEYHKTETNNLDDSWENISTDSVIIEGGIIHDEKEYLTKFQEFHIVDNWI